MATAGKASRKGIGGAPLKDPARHRALIDRVAAYEVTHPTAGSEAAYRYATEGLSEARQEREKAIARLRKARPDIEDAKSREQLAVQDASERMASGDMAGAMATGRIGASPMGVCARPRLPGLLSSLPDRSHTPTEARRLVDEMTPSEAAAVLRAIAEDIAGGRVPLGAGATPLRDALASLALAARAARGG